MQVLRLNGTFTKTAQFVSKLSDSQNWKYGNWIQTSSMKKGFDCILCKYKTVLSTAK